MAAGEDGLPVYPHGFSNRVAYVCLTGAPSDDMRSLDPNREECFQVEEVARGLSSEWAGAPAENGIPYNYSEARFASFNCNAIFRSSYIKREGIGQRLKHDSTKHTASTLVKKKSDSTMLLPYVADPPPTTTPYEAEILERVQARRAPNGLLPLDRALLHSFPIAEGWNTFFGAIRQRTSLTPVISELVMCRVAVLNGAWFEWEHHSPLLTEAGLSDAAVGVVRDSGADIPAKVAERVLSPAEGAVLRYTDAMTKTIAVPDKVSKALRELFSDREVVEITATCAGYNCVSRFLVALDIGEKNQ